jgi:tetratricopeptide (TPR) repeat protein
VDRREPQPIVRTWLIIAFCLAILAALVVGALELRSRLLASRAATAHTAATPAEERKERARAVFLVAPGPIPLGLPLLGPDGVDSDGYPTRYVDRVGLRSLLVSHKYKELTSYFEQFEDAFEADPRKEYWPIDAGDSFASAEAELANELDAWVAATPGSFAPYFARGAHRHARMWAMRGAKYVSETPGSDMREMRRYADRALEDLDKAISLRPKLVAAMRLEINVAMAAGPRERREDMRDRGLDACPPCFQLRAAFLVGQTPRWGGSYDAMDAFVKTAPVAKYPRLRALAGFADMDRAQLLRMDKKYEDSLAALDRAGAAGAYWSFLYERALDLDLLKRTAEALDALNRADALKPMEPDILVERAYVEREREDYLAAGKDLLMALRISPSNVDAKKDLAWVLWGVVEAAQRLEKGGQHEAALQAAELGLELGPVDPHAHQVYSAIALGDATTPERVAALQRRVSENPGDFRAVQQLDYALSRDRRFADILPLWTAYLALHPDDGRAHMERAGTYHQLGKAAEDHADLARACELGVSEGCVRLGQR